jgi:hypothetical protein
MTLRTAKILLVLAVALYYTIVVFSNVTDYGSNYEFLRHVMMMDSTFPGNHGMWRAINAPWAHTAFFLSIDHRVGIRDHDPMLVGWPSAGALASRLQPGISARQDRGDRGADTEPADVVHGVFDRGR